MQLHLSKNCYSFPKHFYPTTANLALGFL